jgi:uncharacterized protein YqkB
MNAMMTHVRNHVWIDSVCMYRDCQVKQLDVRDVAWTRKSDQTENSATIGQPEGFRISVITEMRMRTRRSFRRGVDGNTAAILLVRAETRILLVDTATMDVNEKLKLVSLNGLDSQHSSVTRPGDACQGVGVGQTRVVQGRMDPGLIFVCFD